MSPIRDAVAGASYTISGFSFETGQDRSQYTHRDEWGVRISASDPGPTWRTCGNAYHDDHVGRGETDHACRAKRKWYIERDRLRVLTEFNFDSRELSMSIPGRSRSTPARWILMILGLGMSANVEPFSYAGTPQPVANSERSHVLAEESLCRRSISSRQLRLIPTRTRTACPFSARAAVGEDDIAMTAMTLELDRFDDDWRDVTTDDIDRRTAFRSRGRRHRHGWLHGTGQ